MTIYLVRVVNLLSSVLTWLIVIRALLSWFPRMPYHPVIKVIYEVTDLILRPVQRLIPPRGGLDFSPMVAILFIWLVQRILLTVLLSF